MSDTPNINDEEIDEDDYEAASDPMYLFDEARKLLPQGIFSPSNQKRVDTILRLAALGEKIAGNRHV